MFFCVVFLLCRLNILFYISAQPPGQPEITKKSLERCAVKGDMEMFIIGRNFHKGTSVIFQDPEEADGETHFFENLIPSKSDKTWILHNRG